MAMLLSRTRITIGVNQKVDQQNFILEGHLSILVRHMLITMGQFAKDLQDSLNQCPMPMNGDQNTGIDPKCRSIPLNSNQCQSMIVIDRNRLALIKIYWHFSLIQEVLDLL